MKTNVNMTLYDLHVDQKRKCFHYIFYIYTASSIFFFCKMYILCFVGYSVLFHISVFHVMELKTVISNNLFDELWTPFA